MSYEDIIRAWKDEDYRMSLSKEERAQLPENPAGLIDLMDAEMSMVGGGYGNDTQVVTAVGNLCGSTFCNGNCGGSGRSGGSGGKGGSGGTTPKPPGPARSFVTNAIILCC